jgi:hypothetical protein
LKLRSRPNPSADDKSRLQKPETDDNEGKNLVIEPYFGLKRKEVFLDRLYAPSGLRVTVVTPFLIRPFKLRLLLRPHPVSTLSFPHNHRVRSMHEG